MDYINIGKIMTTHGLNGEVKIKSNFKYKDLVFKVGNFLYVGNSYIKHFIISYRKHQEYDMVILSDIDDIDKAIKLKQENVYILKNELHLENNNYLNEDLIGLDVIFEDKKVGVVIDIIVSSTNELLKLNDFYIPNNPNFIKKIDVNDKKIYVENIEGLML